MRAELCNRFASGCRFCHKGHVRLRGEQPGDALPHDWMIVDTEDLDAGRVFVHESLISLCPNTF